MEQIIVAFAREESCRRIKEILEQRGIASCFCCRSSAQVRRLVGIRRIPLVICGFKLTDGTAEELFSDLPDRCAMLLLASGAVLSLDHCDKIARLSTPVRPGELAALVETLLRPRPGRSPEEATLIAAARDALMTRHGIDERAASGMLRRRSMDGGMRLEQAARLVLEECFKIPPE